MALVTRQGQGHGGAARCGVAWKGMATVMGHGGSSVRVG